MKHGEFTKARKRAKKFRPNSFLIGCFVSPKVLLLRSSAIADNGTDQVIETPVRDTFDIEENLNPLVW